MADAADANPASPSATVRLATPGDVEALGAVTGRAYAAAYPGIVPQAALDEWIADAPAMWLRWRAAVEERPPDHPSRAWVAERDGAIVGYATTSPATSEFLPPPDGAGELTNLYLDPSTIGTGIGRLLYDHAVRDLFARAFDPLVVWAFRDNPLAQRFYPRMGLTVDVTDHAWVLGGVPCPLVRFRGDRPPDASPAG
jgi:ribosomal protein S18 acetylase RimI-like enzyme